MIDQNIVSAYNGQDKVIRKRNVVQSEIEKSVEEKYPKLAQIYYFYESNEIKTNFSFYYTSTNLTKSRSTNICFYYFCEYEEKVVAPNENVNILILVSTTSRF